MLCIYVYLFVNLSAVVCFQCTEWKIHGASFQRNKW